MTARESENMSIKMKEVITIPGVDPEHLEGGGGTPKISDLIEFCSYVQQRISHWGGGGFKNFPN